MSVESMLVNQCRIQRWGTRKPGNDFTLNKPAYVDVASDVAFNLQVYSGSRKMSAGGVDMTFNAAAYFSFDVDIRPGASDNPKEDRIVVTDPGTNEVFYVVAAFDETGHGLFKKVLLKSGL